MAERDAFIQNQDFSPGWVTVAPAHLIEDGATPSVANVDFSESFGRLTKRKGHSIYITANAGGSTKVSGLYQYIQDDADSFLIASSNDDVYSLTAPGTWTSFLTAGALNGAEVNFATFDDLLIIVSDNLTTSKWTGSGASASLGGSPPSNVKFVDTHKRRVFMANSSAGTNRLHYSAVDNAEDWTTANDAGFIDIGQGDGDHISGIASMGSILVIFKTRSTWALYGTGPGNFSVRQLSPSVGCVANKTIVKCDKFCLFLSVDGVYSVNSDGVVLVSYNIKPTVDSITTAARAIACAGKMKTQYWLAIDTDADGVNDEVYVLDYVLGSWGRYTNKKENVFYRLADGTLLSGGADTDVIRQHNTTDNDNGSAISMSWDTKDYDAGAWDRIKHLHDIIMCASPITGKTLTIAHLINGIVQGTTMTFTLTPTSTEDKVYFQRRHLPATSYGAYFRFRLTNAETDANIKVFGYSVKVNFEERHNG